MRSIGNMKRVFQSLLDPEQLAAGHVASSEQGSIGAILDHHGEMVVRPLFSVKFADVNLLDRSSCLRVQNARQGMAIGELLTIDSYRCGIHPTLYTEIAEESDE